MKEAPRLHVERFTAVQFPMLANAMVSLAKEKVQFSMYYSKDTSEWVISHPLAPVRELMNAPVPPPRVA